VSLRDRLKSIFKRPIPEREPGTEGGSLQGQAPRGLEDNPDIGYEWQKGERERDQP
jgi:hypothetical protein